MAKQQAPQRSYSNLDTATELQRHNVPRKRRLRQALQALRPPILGLLLVGLALHQSLSLAREHPAPPTGLPQNDWLKKPLPPTWTIEEVPLAWTYLGFRGDSWQCTMLDTLSALSDVINTSDHEVVIPVFPSVFHPSAAPSEAHYYNTIFRTVASGDKVLVIGCGSGADSWVAFLKSRRPVYVTDINPMAIANTKATAQIAGFNVHALLGDFREVMFPADFSNFHVVCWNMPFLCPDEEGAGLTPRYFHDGDDGSILRAFLDRLPALLTKDGQAIVLNTPDAAEVLGPGWETSGTGSIVYTFANTARRQLTSNAEAPRIRID